MKDINTQKPKKKQKSEEDTIEIQNIKELSDFILTDGSQDQALQFLEQVKERADELVIKAASTRSIKQKKKLLNQSLEIYPFQISTYIALIEIEENNFQRLEIVMNAINELSLMMEFDEFSVDDPNMFLKMKEEYVELMTHYFFTLIECGIYLEAAHVGKSMLQLEEKNMDVAQVLAFLYVGVDWYKELDEFISSFAGVRNCYFEVAILMRHLKAENRSFADAVMQRIDQEFPGFREDVLDLDAEEVEDHDDYRLIGYLLSSFSLYEMLESYLQDSHPQLA